MPLTKRSVSPVLVSLHRLPTGVRQNELECVCNGTLANVVRQMSSLSKHAENIFGELYHEAMKIEHKTNTFANRIERIAAKVTQLDSAVEEVSLQDLHLRKPFKSSSLVDQQSLNRQTMPTAMAECYVSCDKPPDLDKLTVYRTDGKQALKFYTDPDYFFELWRQEMLKDADQARKTKNLNNPKTSVGGEKRQKNKHKQMANDYKLKRLVGNINYDPTFKQPVVSPEQQRPLSNSDYSSRNGSIVNANGYVPTDTNIKQRRPIVDERILMNSGNGLYGSPIYDSPPVRTTAANYRPINIRRTDYSALTPLATAAGMARQTSPDTESKSSSSGSHTARPHQPPPAPPGDSGAAGSTSQTFDDLYTRVVKQGREMTLSPPPPQLRGQDDLTRSMSPDLPPPPPPLFADDVVVTLSEFMPLPPPVAPPPAPPPPPPPTVIWSQPTRPAPPISNFNPPTNKMVKSPSGAEMGGQQSRVAPAAPVPDTRSDLLRAIRDGIQLKRVDRMAERQREQAAIAKGHDVAAILRKRMEDVMGPEPNSDSDNEDGSGSEFHDDWDD